MRTKSCERPPSSLATTSKVKYDPLLWPERAKTVDSLTCASRLSNMTFLSLPVGICPLDDLPMDIDRVQINTTMTDLRRLKLKNQNALIRASHVSETLYRHSRKMFNHALNRAGENGQVISPNLPTNQSRSFSGPTRAGSPIYNKRIQVMNAIRTRPVSVPTDSQRFVHKRGGKMLPIIEQTLARSNEDFRVQIIPNPPKSTCPSQRSSHPDVVLIPTAPLGDEDEEAIDNEECDATDPLDESGEKTVVEEAPTKAKKRLNTHRGSDGRRRHRHWVDDLTVSSVGSNHGDQEKTNQAELNPAETSQVRQTGNQETGEKKTNGADDAGVLDCKKGVENVELQTALPNEENLVLTLRELQEKQLTLPEFKCPSSEEKSREYAIREWLKHTSFTIGNKNVPLL